MQNLSIFLFSFGLFHILPFCRIKHVDLLENRNGDSLKKKTYK